MVAGKFDPPHDGHIEHILKASALGDRLVIITHTDEVLDRIKPKGHQVALWARMALLRGILELYNINGEVRLSIDDDGTVTKTLRFFHPGIFAKGGDRTPNNMPSEEVEACKDIGCRIVYGIGTQFNSSSKIEINKGET